jgi:hypothetical protein
MATTKRPAADSRRVYVVVDLENPKLPKRLVKAGTKIGARGFAAIGKLEAYLPKQDELIALVRAGVQTENDSEQGDLDLPDTK